VTAYFYKACISAGIWWFRQLAGAAQECSIWNSFLENAAQEKNALPEAVPLSGSLLAVRLRPRNFPAARMHSSFCYEF